MPGTRPFRRILTVVMLATLLLPASILSAQRTRDSSTARAPSTPAMAGAPVVFQGDTLLRLFGSFGPFTPAARAAAVTQRLRVLAQSLGAAADSIVVVDHEGFSEIALGESVVMTVLDEDARGVAQPRPLVAQRYGAILRSAALAARKRGTPQALIVDAGLAALATLVLVLVLMAMHVLFPRLYRRIEALRGAHIPAVKIQQFELLSAGRLTTLLVRLARILRLALTLVVVYVYVPLVLSLFPWTEPYSRGIVGYALKPFSAAWAAFVNYLPNVFYLAAGIIITRYVLAFLHMVFEAIGSGAIAFEGFYADWAEPTYKILRVLVFAFAMMALYPFLPGANSDAFKGVSLFLGVLFSLGSSAAIGNMVAGVVLTYTRAFQIGDRVKIGDTVGDVTEKTLLVTRIRTIKNVAVTIPNGTVLSSQVVNYTSLAATHGLILHSSVTIGYDAPWQRVHALLIAAAERTEHVLPEPRPFVLQTSLDDFYVSYEINAYTNRSDIMAGIYSRLHQNIQETFNEGGVEIMSPHYGALRDGNRTTIPDAHLAASYQAPAFRMTLDGGLAAPSANAGSGDKRPSAPP